MFAGAAGRHLKRLREKYSIHQVAQNMAQKDVGLLNSRGDRRIHTKHRIGTFGQPATRSRETNRKQSGFAGIKDALDNIG